MMLKGEHVAITLTFSLGGYQRLSDLDYTGGKALAPVSIDFGTKAPSPL